MTDPVVLWCLIAMAASLVIMALGQIALAIFAAKAARKVTDSVQQVTETIKDVRREVTPVIDQVKNIADDAARAATLVRVQAERLDQLVMTTTQRVEETVTLLQDAVATPLRQGAALMAGLK